MIIRLIFLRTIWYGAEQRIRKGGLLWMISMLLLTDKVGQEGIRRGKGRSSTNRKGVAQLRLFSLGLLFLRLYSHLVLPKIPRKLWFFSDGWQWWWYCGNLSRSWRWCWRAGTWWRVIAIVEGIVEAPPAPVADPIVKSRWSWIQPNIEIIRKWMRTLGVGCSKWKASEGRASKLQGLSGCQAAGAGAKGCVWTTHIWKLLHFT